MSSSSVGQGLQSCLEPRVMEPRVLRLKLALQQGSNFPQPSPTTTTITNTVSLASLCDTKSNNGSGWSFLETLYHTSSCNKKTEDQVYIHPTVKHFSSILSEKSLEMCTESLGSENGSNASESSDEMSLFSFDSSSNSTRNTIITTATATATATLASCKSKRTHRTFPPPLTTNIDFGGVHVRPHRKDGRLILEAVVSPSPRPYFYAERGDGRLRLCLFESFSACWGSEDDVEEEEEEEIESEKNIEEEEEEEEEEGCGEENISGAEEELEECVEDEMGVKKLATPSRCKESGKRDIFGDGFANFTISRFLSVSE